MFKKNRTSRVLSGQVPFFQITSPGTSTPLVKGWVKGEEVRVGQGGKAKGVKW